MKIWNRLNLLVIGLIISILPTFAVSNWVQIDNNTYIDTNSLRKENYSNSNYNSYYSIWLKKFNDDSKSFKAIDSYYQSKVWYMLYQHYIDCNNKRTAVKSIIFYDLGGNSLENSINIKDYNLEFSNVAPGTLAEFEYNYVCTGGI